MGDCFLFPQFWATVAHLSGPKKKKCKKNPAAASYLTKDTVKTKHRF